MIEVLVSDVAVVLVWFLLDGRARLESAATLAERHNGSDNLAA